MKRTIGTAALGLGLLVMTAAAQDMMRGVDLSSPDMVSAEMTRGEVEAALTMATVAAPADFTGKRLSGLDLSGLNLSNAIFRLVEIFCAVEADWSDQLGGSEVGSVEIGVDDGDAGKVGSAELGVLEGSTRQVGTLQ